ncbi:MAG: extracellular solute-binding protein [Treponema sp.]|nr:extracellular solute-binding protein [Treponema sp.]
MRKTLAFALTLIVATAMVAVTLLSCADRDEGRVVVRLGIWPEDTLPHEIAMHREFVRIFNERFPDVVIRPSSYRYAVDTFVPMAEAGLIPTIFETWFTEPGKLIPGGFVRDITDELDALGWTEKMNESVKNLLSRDGRIYGVPRDAYALGLMLNMELFRDAGLVDEDGLPLYPRTWAELASTARIIRERTGRAGLVLLAMDNAGGWHFTNIAWGFGAEFMAERNGRWIAQIDTPEVLAAMQFVRDLRWEYDVLTASPTTETWASGFQAIGTGLAAMYIAAQDAVNQPTMVNGLPVGDLALVPMPAGPRGQYSLMGGTPYMFARNATSDEVTYALRYLEIMGRAPVVTDDSIAGLMADARMRRDSGVPVIPTFPAWTCPDFLVAQQQAIDAYINVDMRLFNDYFEMISQGTNLRSEEPQLTQDLYSELTNVLQAVLTNRNANIPALLGTAQANFQRMLDAQVNN